MISKNKNTYTPDAALVPVPTVDVADTNKCSLPLDIRSTVSNPSYQYPMTLIVAVPRNKLIPDATNTPVEPTEVFKTIVSNITESLTFLVEIISYEPKTVLLQLEDLKKKLIDAAANYKAVVPHPNKALLPTINYLLKILTVHLQDQQTHYFTDLNLNPDLKAKATINTHCF